MTLHDRLEALQHMTTGELRRHWREVMGDEPRSYNRSWLWRRLAWAIQAREFGGLSAQARGRLDELLPHAETWMPLGRRGLPARNDAVPAPRRPLLAPGTVLTRRYKGRTVVVSVREDGFEYDGRLYGSLTAVATAVTGSHWNGRHFFGLRRDGKAG